MNPYAASAIVAGVVAMLIAFLSSLFRTQTVGGPLSPGEHTLLLTGMASSVLSVFFPSIIPSIVSWITKIFPGGQASNGVDIQKLIEMFIQQIAITPPTPAADVAKGGLVDVIKALLAAYSKGGIPAVVFEALQKVKLSGMPRWFYIGAGWDGTPAHVFSYGQVPEVKPMPEPPPAVKQVIYQTPEPVPAVQPATPSQPAPAVVKVVPATPGAAT